MKIAVTTSTFAEQDPGPLDLLRANFDEVRLNPHGRTLSAEETVGFLAGCAGVLAGTEPYSAELFAARPELRVVSRCGAGLDSVDLKAAAAKGVAVLNTPDGPSPAVAELTLALALDLARRISLHDRNLRNGAWRKRLGRLLAGQQVAVIGYGRIGRRVAGLFRALGCRVAVCDPYADSGELPNRPLAELLPCSDGLTLHCAPPPGGPLLGRAELALMKPGAWLINAARGGLVDEEALAEALAEGRLSGAALDVFEREPYQGPLTGLDTALLTPHIGSYAREARIGMEREAAENLLRGLGRDD
ncbi:MAG: hydroxyacid dehydrogenase [Candidatus Adiutrix sp.]|jgi:D-3-phosphoglycerate dehydrogenase|nr:hydroxyacid dehydrogenase [Candidatus Adiutrix sp.]